MAQGLAFLDLAARDEAAPLLSDDLSEAWVTVGELRARAHEWSARLAGPKALVFHYIPNSVDGVAQLLGALHAGHAVALLDPNLPDDSKASLASHYQPGLVLSGEGTIEVNPQGTRDIHPDLAVLLSTSGSTGSPKFVRLTRASLEHNALAIAEALDIQPTEVGCGHLSLHYSYGLSVLLSHLARGAPVHLTQRGFLDPEFWPQMRAWKIAHMPGVPFHYQTLRRLRFENMDLASLRVMTQAGGALDTRIRTLAYDFMANIGGQFHVMYGQTEAAPRITTLSHADFATHPNSVGPCLTGGRLEAVGDDGTALPPNAEGELIYHGPNVMMGYAETPEDLALGDTQNGRLVTGDIGFLDADGRLTITGRSKRVGKIAGLRVNLDEVERLLTPHLGEVVAVQSGEALAVYHLPHVDVDKTRTDAMTALTARFTLPRVSYRFKVIDAFPRTGRGKYDYKALGA